MSNTHITIHCTATVNVPSVTVASITREHIKRGFRTIGYHFLIDHFGIVQKGRSEMEAGAHVKGHNIGNLGIALVGGVDKNGKPEFNFTDLQLASLRSLVNALAAKYRIPPENILGHRDWFGDTNGDGVIDSRDWLKECPCFDVKPWYNDDRE